METARNPPPTWLSSSIRTPHSLVKVTGYFAAAAGRRRPPGPGPGDHSTPPTTSVIIGYHLSHSLPGTALPVGRFDSAGIFKFRTI
eukprot:746193-Hanusia_phi.AAC.5